MRGSQPVCHKKASDGPASGASHKPGEVKLNQEGAPVQDFPPHLLLHLLDHVPVPIWAQVTPRYDQEEV